MSARIAKPNSCSVNWPFGMGMPDPPSYTNFRYHCVRHKCVLSYLVVTRQDKGRKEGEWARAWDKHQCGLLCWSLPYGQCYVIFPTACIESKEHQLTTNHKGSHNSWQSYTHTRCYLFCQAMWNAQRGCNSVAIWNSTSAYIQIQNMRTREGF
jgi:hypothetical protein